MLMHRSHAGHTSLPHLCQCGLPCPGVATEDSFTEPMNREVLTTSAIFLERGEYSIICSQHQRCSVVGVLLIHLNPRCGQEEVDTIKVTIMCCPMQCSTTTILQR